MKFLKNLFKSTDSANADPTPDTQSRSKPNSASKTRAQHGKKSPPANSAAKSPDKRREKQSAKSEKPAAKSEQAATEPPVTLAGDFATLDLPDELNRAIAKLGFENCTPVQKQVLPHSLAGKDIIAQAQTGTGKTAAFLISIMTLHLENPEEYQRAPGTPFALIIAPTRELAMQITADAEELGRYMDIKSLSVVGGIDYEKQRNQLGGRVDIVVATPGRLLDFCRSNVVDLKSVEILIIDEADRMLSMGFIPDVKSIISRMPRRENRQTQLFSATFSEDIRRLSEQWTNDPMRVDIEPEQLAVDSVDQRFFLTSSESKFNVLFNLINSEGVDRVIVFVNRRDQTRYLYERLQRYDISCGMLTGEVPQRKRISTLEKFKAGNTKVLVATDVAGRGIHVDNISHVVNYNMPEDPEDYVHRIGRTGRAGALGTSISLICEDDSFMMPQIETLLGEALNYQQPPEELLAEIPKPLRPAVPSTRPASRHSSSGRPSSGRPSSGRSSHARSSNSRRR